MTDRTLELIEAYHKGVDWAREAVRIRADIVEKRAQKKEDDIFYPVGEWLEKVRDASAEELVSAIRTWYDNHFEDEIEIEEQAMMLEIQYNHTGDIAATVKAFEKAFVKDDDVLISKYVDDILAAWAKSSQHAMILGKVAIHKKPTIDEQIASAKALEEIMETNKKLVSYFLRKKYPSYFDSAEREDITSEGVTGMLQSLIYYSPSKSKLSTFIAPFIKGAINDYISRKQFGSTHYHLRNKQYVIALDSLCQKGIEAPTMTQLAEEMDVGLDAVQRFMLVKQSANAVDMDREEVNEVEDTMSARPDEVVIMKERAELLDKALSRLPEDQRIVIEMLFYTINGKQSSYTAIGKKLVEHYNSNSITGQPVTEVKKEKVKQLRSRAMKTLRYHTEQQLSENENTLASKFAKIGIFPKTDVETEMSHLDHYNDDEWELDGIAV